MAINLSREDLNSLVDTIAFLPQNIEVSGRSALLAAAFAGYPNARRMLGRINFSGDVTVFTTQMITHLTTFGQIEKDVEALGVLLKHIADPDLLIVGVEDRAFLNKLIAGYQMLPGVASKEKLANATEPPKPATSNGDADDEATDGCYIFISYARPNVDIASKIAAGLDAEGINFFQDIRDIESGDMWSQTIERALWKADRMVLLLSKASMPFRKEVEREWFFFDMKGKPIHTVLVEDCDINSRLMQINYIDARTDHDAAVAKLLEALKKECKKT